MYYQNDPLPSHSRSMVQPALLPSLFDIWGLRLDQLNEDGGWDEASSPAPEGEAEITDEERRILDALARDHGCDDPSQSEYEEYGQRGLFDEAGEA